MNQSPTRPTHPVTLRPPRLDDKVGAVILMCLVCAMGLRLIALVHDLFQSTWSPWLQWGTSMVFTVWLLRSHRVFLRLVMT